MPGERRTDRISQRDLEVLEFVARFGVVPREAVATWAGTARAVTVATERRMRKAGLIEVRPGFGDTGRIVRSDWLPSSSHAGASLTLRRINLADELIADRRAEQAALDAARHGGHDW